MVVQHILEKDVTPNTTLNYIVEVNNFFFFVITISLMGYLKKRVDCCHKFQMIHDGIRKKDVLAHSLKIFTNMWKLQMEMNILIQILAKLLDYT